MTPAFAATAVIEASGAAPHTTEQRERAERRSRATPAAGSAVPRPALVTRAIAAALTTAEVTPCLVVDRAVVRDRYRELARALPGVALHYAIKANPDPRILAALAEEGCSWDVASPGEVAACLAIGADPAAISYGNPVASAAAVRTAHRAGVRTFTVDSPGVLAAVTAAAPGSVVLVRLVTDGRGADWPLSGKFGCPPAQAGELLLAAAAAGHAVGVSFHVGSQQRDPHAWDTPLAATAVLRSHLRGAGYDLAAVDLGGGFPARLAGVVPDVAAYGRAVMTAVRRHLGADLPHLMAEPGRGLVADAGVLEAEVVLAVERHGRRWVYLDLGLFNGLGEAVGEAVRYQVVTDRDGGTLVDTVLAGPSCDSVDVLYRQVQLPGDLVAGDRVRFLAAGAYTSVYATTGFNGFPPPAVTVVG